jgi:hypothetical protein
MFWFKSCPKCHGDLYRNSDIYGTYIACMQCSHYLSQAEEARVGLSTGTIERGMVVQAELERAAA